MGRNDLRREPGGYILQIVVSTASYIRLIYIRLIYISSFRYIHILRNLYDSKECILSSRIGIQLEALVSLSSDCIANTQGIYNVSQLKRLCPKRR